MIRSGLWALSQSCLNPFASKESTRSSQEFSQKPWQSSVSTSSHNSISSILARPSSPGTGGTFWSAYLPFQENASFGVQLLIPPASLETLSKAFPRIYGQPERSLAFSLNGTAKEFSNIASHSFCGELGRILRSILTLAVPEISKGSCRDIYADSDALGNLLRLITEIQP